MAETGRLYVRPSHDAVATPNGRQPLIVYVCISVRGMVNETQGYENKTWRDVVIVTRVWHKIREQGLRFS